MRIDLVSEHASPLAAIGGVDAGGQNVHVAALAAGLADRGHQVTVHTRRDDAALPDEVVVQDGYTVAHVTAGPARVVPKDDLLPHMAEFGEVLRARWAEQRPDVVHAHFWMSGLASVEAARVDAADRGEGAGVLADQVDPHRVTSPSSRSQSARNRASP